MLFDFPFDLLSFCIICWERDYAEEENNVLIQLKEREKKKKSKKGKCWLLAKYLLDVYI